MVLGYNACLSPLNIQKKLSNQELIDAIINSQSTLLEVPCGKCINCRKKKSREWAFRIERDIDYSHSHYFITLTYSEENIHKSPNGMATLNPKDLTDFWKRLRKENLKTSKEKIGYFACGEYGEQFQRPHYHAIIFNLTKKTLSKLQHVWTAGHVHIGDANTASIHYVTNYMLNKENHVNNDRFIDAQFKTIKTHNNILNKTETRRELVGLKDDRQAEFRRMSKGLGLRWLTDKRIKFYKKQLKPFFRIEGKIYSMSRYYRDKIFNDQEKEKMFAEMQKEHFLLLKDYLKIYNYDDYRKNKQEVKNSNLRKHRKATKTKRLFANV